MKSGLKFSAIDIGSNAIRLLLSEVLETDEEICFKKISLIRMPIRLGEDVFVHRRISDIKIDQLIHTMTGFRHLIKAFQPISYRACATSAMREAENSHGVCERIQQTSGIAIHVIDGREEAEIIFSNGDNTGELTSQSQVYVDVGGGSTEITILNGEQRVSRSFNIGTIRLMQDMVTSQDWNRMKQWVQDQTASLENLIAVGSGGNIHKILRLSKAKEHQGITIKQMKKVRKLLKSYTVAERITRLGLKPDRADVILPAHKIYYSVLKWGEIPSIRVPQMGLADGIVRQLYAELLS